MTDAAPRRTPWWVSALDVLCLLVLALVVRSLVGDRYRLSLAPGLRLSLSSWQRLSLSLAALLVLRHFAWPVAPWPSRVLGWGRRVATWEPLGAVFLPFVTSRLAVALAGYVAVFTIGFASGRASRALSNDWLDLYARWDAGWYYTIASLGYPTSFDPAGQNPIAFFPGLPLLMRGAAAVLDANLWIAGILVVTLAFLWALTYFYRLALDHVPADQARASVMLLAWYPFAICYSAVLTESLFLLAAVAAFYHFRRSELWRAGLFGLLAGLLRPNGCLLSVPLALAALLPFVRNGGWRSWRRAGDATGWTSLFARLSAASMPGIGMLAYSAYLNSTIGSPFAWIAAQQAWGRTTAGGLGVAVEWLDFIQTRGLSVFLRSFTVEIIEAAAAFFALGAIWPIVRRFGLPYGVFVAVSVLPPLISMGQVSLGRYTAPMFPVFLWLGAVIPQQRRQYWIAMFAAGQAVVATLFFTGRPPY